MPDCLLKRFKNKCLRVSILFFPITLFFSIIISFTAIAQSNTNSPYSRYGIGEIKDNLFPSNFSMGGLGTALQTDTITPFNVNLSNPASLPYLRVTTFESGFTSNTSQLTAKGQTQVTNATSFGYLALAFPITRWWGSALSLQPLSGVGYNVTNTQTLDSVGTVNYIYKGSGGINKVSWSNGFKSKNLSFGANASYLFGRIDNSRKAIMPFGGYFNTLTTARTNISDFYFDYGVQYGITRDSVRHREMRDKVRIVWGATFATMTDINVTSNVLSGSYVVNDRGYDQPVDTAQNITHQKNTIRLPAKFSTGFSLRKGDRLVLGLEYTMQNWSAFELLGVNGGLKNSSKVMLGLQYTPAHKTEIKLKATPYYKKVTYRAGFRYANLPVDVKGQLKEMALSLGFTLPVGPIIDRANMVQYNLINLGFEVGQRGSTSVLQEQFFNVIIGVTLNDRWFVKSKYD